MEYPLLTLSAASIGICEQGVSPFYDIVWSFDYYLENITPDTEFGFLFFLQRDSIIPVGGTPGPGLGYTKGGILNGIRRPDDALSLYFRPDSTSVYSTPLGNGLSGGVIGIGFDSTGCYALPITYEGEQERDGINTPPLPNSVTIRGGAPAYSYAQYSTNFTLSNFNIIDGRKKTVRARLGNLGRTIYIDYRYTPEEDFIPVITKDVNLDIGIYELLRPGITLTKNISSLKLTAVPRVIMENFHFEGKREIPKLDEGTQIPQLSSRLVGAMLEAASPLTSNQLGVIGNSGIYSTDCPIRTITVKYSNNNTVGNATVSVDNKIVGTTNVNGIITFRICDGRRSISAFLNEFTGVKEVYVDNDTQNIDIIIYNSIGIVPRKPSKYTGPATLPSQLHNSTHTINAVSAFFEGYDENQNITGDIFNFGYYLSVIPQNDILYRVEPFKYINKRKTFSLTLSSFDDTWKFNDMSYFEPVEQTIFTYSLSTNHLSAVLPTGTCLSGTKTLTITYI